jgi:uncharacterized iron-regulated membrane protein
MARYYSWHRALGLMGAIPSLFLVTTGVLRVFEAGVSNAIGAQEISMPARPGTPILPFAQAVRIGERSLPGSSFTAVTLPSAEDATYTVRLHTPREWRRHYGYSFVYVDAVTGAVRGVFPASEASWPRAFMDDLFPFHTGEAGGVIGRLLVTAMGLWLIAMILLGVRLWWLRRKGRKRT